MKKFTLKKVMKPLNDEIAMACTLQAGYMR